jgi:hypothetical protein
MIRFDRSLATLMVHKDEIRPDPLNDNNGDVDNLVTSIEVNGCYRPILVNEESKMITAGHTLYAALLELGANYVPVLWGDGDDQAHKRRLITDNQSARLARRDDALTVQLLDEMKETDLGLLGTSFTEDDYVRLMLSSSPDNFGSWGPSHPDPINLHETTCPECGHTWSD